MANEKRAHTDPAHVLAMVELINNDNERIDWDYWAGKMPRWTTYQAVRLMAALDPAKHPDLSFKRNETAGAAKEQAKRLELLAASHGKAEASPRDWLKWADDLHESVHEGCRIAIENLTSVGRVPRVSKAPAPIITPLPGGSSGTFLSWNTAKRRQSSDRPPRWSKWRLMPEVRVWEAVALSLGIEPEQVETNRNAWMGAKYPFDEDNEFTDRLDVTIANVRDRNRFPTPCTINMGNAYLNGVRLSEFARFAIEVAQWDMPDELQALAAIGPAAQQQSAAPSATPATTPIVPTTASGAPTEASQPSKDGDGMQRLEIGNNPRAKVEAYVSYQATLLRKDGDTLKSLSQKILETVRGGCLGERGPITSASITRMLPAGITGGLKSNGKGRKKGGN